MKCAVIGLGRFGRSLAYQLRQAGAEVIAIDLDAHAVDEAKDQVSVAVALDSTTEEELIAQGVGEVDVAVVAIGTQFESAALTTALLKKLGVKRVIARATSPLRGRILKLIGADEVVSPEEEAARETAHRILRPALADFLKLTAARSVVEVIAPPTFTGKTLKELELRKQYHVQVLGIKRRQPKGDPRLGLWEEIIIDTPDAHEPLRAGDAFIAVGNDTDLGRFVSELEKER